MNWTEYEERYGESRDDHEENYTCLECGGMGCPYCYINEEE